MDASDTLGAKVLARAAQILGGTPQLRKYLRVSALSLGVWMAGTEPPPTEVFLKAVDVIVDRDVENLLRDSPKA